MTFLILLVVLAGVGFRLTTPDERARYLQNGITIARHLREVATRRRPECDAFHAALRERRPRAWVTIAFAAAMAASVAAPGGIDAWGNTALKTTNGEWWRLVTAMFVHAGPFQLLLNIVVFVQIGLVLERLLGHGAFAVAFLAAGIFANLVNMSKFPLAVGAGASGAIFGLYGVLLATLLWSLRQPSDVAIPKATLNTMGVWAVLFTLVSLANGSLVASAEMTGLAAGVVGGLILARTVSEHEPPPQHVTIVAGVSAAMAFAVAVPMRGLSDVRPEVQRVVAIEDRTTAAYQTAAEQFRRGRLSAEALAQVIDKAIVPELQAEDAHLKTYKKVPVEHQPIVVDAADYLRLRTESWRLRAAAVRKTSAPVRRDAEQPTSDEKWRLKAEARHRASLVTQGNAEAAERTSLAAYQKVKIRSAT